MDANDYDTTEKIERTDVGFRLTIESTRGTGTRDQDKVKAELRTEEKPGIETIRELHMDVADVMAWRREDQPEADDE